MKIEFDLHTHTIMSGHAYSTLKENIDAAKEKGLSAYGFSEHAPKMYGSVKDIYFMNFKSIPKEVNGVKVLSGVEANIINFNGETDCDKKILKRVDYAIASLHLNCITPGTKEENTLALVGAMRNPLIKIIGHPDDSRYEIDYDLLVKTAVETKTILELNNSSLNPLSPRKNTKDNMVKLMETCRKYNAKVILGSDAHFYSSVGDFSLILELIEEVNFPKELIINYDIQNLNLILNKK